MPPLDPTKEIGSPGPAGASVRRGLSVFQSQLKTLAVLTAILVFCFAKPLYDLIRFALHSELFSHVLLIPFISGYLVWLKKDSLRHTSPPVRSRALVPSAAGVLVLIGSWFAAHIGFVVRHDYLTWTALSLLLLFAGACFFCLGSDTMRAISFPLRFLLFMVPFPGFLVDAIETFLQHSSAVGADWFFSLTGMSFVRDGLIFQLPGIRLEVAPECSGIHSSLVLFITSVLAGQLFLVSPWKRVLLAFAIVPLGILRNAFRIWVIGELCVHISPNMINSWIHRRGGPVFFVLSLVPLFMLLLYLRRSDQKLASPGIGLSEARVPQGPESTAPNSVSR